MIDVGQRLLTSTLPAACVCAALVWACGCSGKKHTPDVTATTAADTRTPTPELKDTRTGATADDTVASALREIGTPARADGGEVTAPGDVATGDSPSPGPAPIPPDENMARLLECTRGTAVRVFDPLVRTRLLLRLAVLEAAYDPSAAARTIEKCQLEGAAADDVARAFGAIASRDLKLCLKIISGQPAGELRDTYLASTALALVSVDPEKAAEVAARVDSRIAREFLLLELVRLAASLWPDRIEKVTAHIIEPLYNDEAFALIAEETAASAPGDAISQVDKIEAELVKRWTLLYVGFRIAVGDPVAALQLDRMLMSVYYRDELYAEVATHLAGKDSEKALTLALRISDPFLKKDAVAEVAAAMIRDKPSLALHILRKNLDFIDADTEVTALLTGLCRTDAARFETTLAEVQNDLGKKLVADILSACCSSAPELVLRETAKRGLESKAQLRVCAACADPGPEALTAAQAIGDPRLRNEAYQCLAKDRAATDLPAALEIVKLIDDALGRDETHLMLVELLAAGEDPALAARISLGIADPYLAAKAALALLGGTPEEEYDKRVTFIAEKAGKVRDRWRQDELLARLARHSGSRDLKAALDLASGLVDVELQQSVLNDLARTSFAAGLEQAEKQQELFLDLAGKAAWCLRLAELHQASLDAKEATAAEPKTEVP